MPDPSPTPVPATHDVARLSIDTIRLLAADAVEKAQSGHPGLPMGCAALAYVLWHKHLRHNPADPTWFDRDRFVLSAGHGSMLLYGLLHLTGYPDMTLEQIQNFRQLHSLTPGHPESFVTPGIETTTGPLGQGIGNAVGMAMAEAHLAATYNTPEQSVIAHHTYCLVSDGDLMEGVSHEAASLAGHLGLGRLVVLWDDNRITIDGPTTLSFTDDTVKRFEAYGWHTLRVDDGNDLDAIDRALTDAKAVTDRPSFIAVRTVIGFGSPTKQGTSKAHSDPLGAEEIARVRETLGWPYDEPFTVPDEAKAHMDASERGAAVQSAWEDTFAAWARAHPERAEALQTSLAGALPQDWDADVPTFAEGDDMASRAASGKVLGALAGRVPWLVGGSADLTPSNKTDVKGRKDFEPATPEGGYFRFGVREHGMAAAMNGMLYHGGLRPYGGTFLVFVDYLRPALRLAALAGLPAIYVFTHDSIGVGEDGPTHQPIAQLASLRAIPHLNVLRPADANETAEAWKIALEDAERPTVLALTRQTLPTLDVKTYPVRQGVKKGGYVLRPETGALDLILVAAGSEVHLALEAAAVLEADGYGVRVVSMPSMELFERQTAAYREKVLPTACRARLAIEAGAAQPWYRYVGLDGDVVAMDRFGASAPAPELFELFGFTAANVVKRARKVLKGMGQKDAAADADQPPSGNA